MSQLTKSPKQAPNAQRWCNTDAAGRLFSTKVWSSTELYTAMCVRARARAGLSSPDMMSCDRLRPPWSDHERVAPVIDPGINSRAGFSWSEAVTDDRFLCEDSNIWTVLDIGSHPNNLRCTEDFRAEQENNPRTTTSEKQEGKCRWQTSLGTSAHSASRNKEAQFTKM